MSEVLWSLDSVCLAGAHGTRLDDVTLQIRKGVTAVMGCSGAGKTSLLNLLVAFEKPDRGTVQRTLPDGVGSVPVFWVPQDGGLWPHLTAREHLDAVAPSGATPAQITDLLDCLGIMSCERVRPDELSMGQRSRLAIARALMADPAVLVMDEPLAHVDRAAAAQCWDLIRRQRARSGASLVFATHSARMVLGEGERVICLWEGRVVCEGDVEDLYWRPASRAEAEFLGEANWLTPTEARLWLGDGQAAQGCLRPEQIRIEPAPDGPFTVKSSRFHGDMAEAELVDDKTGCERRFYHRPARDSLRPGDRVWVRALFVLLLVLLVGCGRPEAPALAVRSVGHWAVPADSATVPAPRSVAVGPDGEVVVLDTAGRVLVFDTGGTLRRQWRMPAVEAGKPEGVCVLRSGDVLVADTHYHRLVLFDRDGTVLREIGRSGTGPGEFVYPVAVAQDGEENLYACEYGGNDRVQKFAPDGTHLLSFGSFGTGTGQFQRPSGLAWHAGRLYVADAINNRIQVFSDDGRFLSELGTGEGQPALRLPYGVAAAPDGSLYVVEYSGGCVTRLGADGRLLGRYGSPGRGAGQLLTPWGLAVDSKMRLLVADTGNRRIVDLNL